MRCLINARNRSVAVADGKIVRPSGAFDIVVDAPDADVGPGLINSHDHLHRNHYGRLGKPPYGNARQWARDIQRRYRQRIAEGRRRQRREALLAGAWKNLFAGVTTVVHHDPWEADFDFHFPLRVLRVPNADWVGSGIGPEQFGGCASYCLHVAEGIDSDAAGEVRELDRLGLLTSRLIAVHGVALDRDAIDSFVASGAALAWCPTSNLFLFGRTAPDALLQGGVDILLGSDSLLTGSGDLLDEIRFARAHGPLADAILKDAVGSTPARRLGLPVPSLEVGAEADLVLLNKPLLEARAEDVALVMVAGVPRVAKPDLVPSLGPVADHGELITLGSITRWANARTPRHSQETRMTKRIGATIAGALCAAAAAVPAHAQDAPPLPPAQEQPGDDQEAVTDEMVTVEESETDAQESGGIFSRNAFAAVLDARLVVANGERSWVNGGLGKTRFQGTFDGDYKLRAVPVEATIAWMPRFTRSLSANISASWQRDQEKDIDLNEAFVSFLPPQSGAVSFSARAGLMWPEISLEHSTGGAWSAVNTITPSAINSWVGEEVKVVGLEATVHATLGEHQLDATGAAFGFNDTSGTLLSFRGWALHDLKATAFGHFPLPPLNEFIVHLQEDRTRSIIEIDKRVGFYGRLDWRPPAPFGAALFYYDNRGDPEAFETTGQWGWRTRFLNLGVNADLGPATKLLVQAMTGSTIMGFETDGERWVRTRFRSAFALVSHQLTDDTAITGRIEAFRTRERGSEMSPLESERGWSWTAAARHRLNDNLALYLEALNVRSRRGIRTESLGLRPFQAQTVFQASLRLTL